MGSSVSNIWLQYFKMVIIAVLLLYTQNIWASCLFYKDTTVINSNSAVLSHVETKKLDLENYRKKGRFDLVLYPQFRFKNSRLDQMYLLQVNINPTLEMSTWSGGLLTAQVILPVFNEYSLEEGRVRPGFVTFSQYLDLGQDLHLLATIGNFNNFRSGADIKAVKIIKDRAGVYAQAGVTAWTLALFEKLVVEDFDKTHWRAGGFYFYKPARVLFNLNVAKYLGNDVALRGEITRYFSNSAVGFYIQTLNHDGYSFNGGFFFSIKIPSPNYKRNRKIIYPRPSDFFSIEYIARPYPLRGRWFNTSPDESSSFNFFNRGVLNRNL